MPAESESQNLNIEPEKTLFSWKAPSRPFKRRNREFYVTVIAIAAIVGLVIFLAEGIMPVILIVSLVFLFYVLNTIEPEEVEYKITSRGIKVGQKLSPWTETIRFWFSQRYDSKLLIFQTVNLPGRMELVVKDEDREEIKKTLKNYVLEEEIPPSSLDKLTNWISEKLPGGK